MFQALLLSLFAFAFGGGIVPYTSPLGATLLPKVNVGPPKVTVVRQPYVITETEAVYRSVPLPVNAVAYNAPKVIGPAVYSTPLAVTASLAASVW